MSGVIANGRKPRPIHANEEISSVCTKQKSSGAGGKLRTIPRIRDNPELFERHLFIQLHQLSLFQAHHPYLQPSHQCILQCQSVGTGCRTSVFLEAAISF